MTFQEFVDKYQKVPVEEYQNNVLEKVPNPIVSCRVSTYQHAPYIKQCLDGILMQKTNFPFEIVIGEDESSDGTREICIEYADKYPNIIRLFLHKRENNILIDGRPSARFQGTYTMNKLRGKYHAICEGDDYWTDPLKLQKQVDFLEGNEDVTVIYHRVGVIGQFGKRTTLSNQRRNEDFYFTLNDSIQAKQGATLSMMFRKSIITKMPMNLFSDLSIGDWPLECWLTLYGRGFFCNQSMGVYRIHEKGASTDLNQYSFFDVRIKYLCRLIKISKNNKHNYLFKSFLSRIYLSRSSYNFIQKNFLLGLKDFCRGIFYFKLPTFRHNFHWLKHNSYIVLFYNVAIGFAVGLRRILLNR